MNSSIVGSSNDWVLLKLNGDVLYDDAEDGQHHKVELDGLDGEPQVHLEDAQDGEDVDGEDTSPASSHGSYSDPEFMGPNAQWKCVFWKS